MTSLQRLDEYRATFNPRVLVCKLSFEIPLIDAKTYVAHLGADVGWHR
jgi:hypothetical protein